MYERPLPHAWGVYAPEATPEQIAQLREVVRGFGWAIVPQLSDSLSMDQYTPDALHAPDVQDRLDTPLSAVQAMAASRQARVALATLRRSGLSLLRDTLVVGADHLAALRGVSAQGVASLRPLFTEVTPEVPLIQRPSIETVARICPDLARVTIEYVQPEAYYLRLTRTREGVGSSVQDIIDKPALAEGIDLLRIPYEQRQKYRLLHERACAFAESFAAARRQLGLDAAP